MLAFSPFIYPIFFVDPLSYLYLQLAAALGLAVAIMCSWHVLQIAWGETSVEGHDNTYYRSLGKGFENPYDLGWRKNLKEGFLNVGEGG